MKRIFPIDSTTKRRWNLAFATLAFLGVNPFVQASPELDRQYKLETVGVLRAWDNVDGIFNEYIKIACADYFSHQSRFLMNDIARGDTLIVESKLPYLKIIHDPAILAQLARSTRSETILRTKVLKEGQKYFVTMEWLHSPEMDVMSTVNFTLKNPTEGASFQSSELSAAIQENLAKLISQVPFYAHTTGRDHSAITLNLGSGSNITKGDVLTLATLDQVRKHPLLNNIVDWRLTPTGKVQVEQIDEGITFAKIIEEIPGQEIAPYQKVIEIQSAPSTDSSGEMIHKKQEPAEKEESSPTLGWIGTSFLIGNFNRQFSSTNTTLSAVPISNTGGGFLLGGKLNGELWLTKEWLADLELGYGFWTYSQQDVNTNTQSQISRNGGVSGSLTSFKANIGYAFLITSEQMGPRIWLKAGYKSNSYSLPTDALSEFTGPISVDSIFLGTGGDLPIRNGWGLSADFNFKLFTFVSQNWMNDTPNGTSDIEFSFNGYYRITKRLKAQIGFELKSSSVDFTLGSNVTQKTITFGPALLYYF